MKRPCSPPDSPTPLNRLCVLTVADAGRDRPLAVHDPPPAATTGRHCGPGSRNVSGARWNLRPARLFPCRTPTTCNTGALSV